MHTHIHTLYYLVLVDDKYFITIVIWDLTSGQYNIFLLCMVKLVKLAK